mmetsp:Transcript_27013/g.92193  ORF Transcript_27013/g.92193 Transcript_27013/m.92193 type:complete len:229 (-) Transcript_27013:362-1048(-)
MVRSMEPLTSSLGLPGAIGRKLTPLTQSSCPTSTASEVAYRALATEAACARRAKEGGGGALPAGRSLHTRTVRSCAHEARKVPSPAESSSQGATATPRTHPRWPSSSPAGASVSKDEVLHSRRHHSRTRPSRHPAAITSPLPATPSATHNAPRFGPRTSCCTTFRVASAPCSEAYTAKEPSCSAAASKGGPRPSPVQRHTPCAGVPNCALPVSEWLGIGALRSTSRRL